MTGWGLAATGSRVEMPSWGVSLLGGMWRGGGVSLLGGVSRGGGLFGRRSRRCRQAERQRVGLLAAAPPGSMRDYLGVPFPDCSVPGGQLRLLAVDLETTGLDPARDEILSIGFVPVDGPSIVLSGARQMVVRGAAEVGQSAAIHGLTDDAVAAGEALSDALAAVLDALAGRVLLAHHAALDRDFLSAACLRSFGTPLACLSVDTMALEQRLVAGGWRHEQPEESVRLAAARDRRGLPRYRAHDALTDALACAELYLAQTAALASDRTLTMGALLD
jgi:DNA polymerase-3 subunit epsilon